MILSLDCSTKSTGWAIFDEKKLISYDCIISSSADLIKRIFIMIKGIDNILSHNHINTIIVEEVRPELKGTSNLNTYRALMYLQAALMFLVHEKYPKIKVDFVYPGTWRAACGIHVGRGIKRQTLKEADIKFVIDNYHLTPNNDDIADAICIGHAYINKLDNELNWE